MAKQSLAERTSTTNLFNIEDTEGGWCMINQDLKWTQEDFDFSEDEEEVPATCGRVRTSERADENKPRRYLPRAINPIARVEVEEKEAEPLDDVTPSVLGWTEKELAELLLNGRGLVPSTSAKGGKVKKKSGKNKKQGRRRR